MIRKIAVLLGITVLNLAAMGQGNAPVQPVNDGSAPFARSIGEFFRPGSDPSKQKAIRPFAVGFFDKVRTVAAWCEMRKDFRHFRTDRIVKLTLTETRYPRRRRVLAKEWREKEGIATQ